MLTRALILAQATTALAGALLVGHPHTAQVEAVPMAPPAPYVAEVPEAVVHPAARRVRPAVRRTLPRKESAPARKPVPHHRVRSALPAAPTSVEQAIAAALRRLPGYQPGSTTWVVTTAYGSWGTADWYDDRVYLSPNVPKSRMYDVVAHEWSHLLSVRPYGGNVNAAVAAMNWWFGGTDLAGAERAADCMAKQLGAQWTHYTPCEVAHWQDGARILLSGRPLPTS